MQALQSQLSSAESQQRGFLITENQQYLDAYYLNASTLNQQVNIIRELTDDNPVQQQHIQALEPLLKKRLTLLQQTLNIRRLKGFELAQ
ncbi:CHASE3 domain-containing protein [Nostoc sp. XA013]|nr:CHASE3 domain-containing protein [Nostoc sp. XA013]